MIRRINPHELGFIGPNGIRRIARLGSAAVGEVAFKPVERKPLVIEKPSGYIMAVLHAKEGKLSALDREVLYVARVLAGREAQVAVLAVIFGDIEEDMTRHGVDRQVVLDNLLPQDKAACVEKLRGKYQARHILFGEGDAGDSDLARRCAVAAGLSIGTEVIEVEDERIRRIFDNGLQQGTSALTDIIVLTSGVAAVDIDFVTEAKAEEWHGGDEGGKGGEGVSSLRDYALAAENIPLEEANFILSAGNGVANMETFFSLAEKMGASIGGSRVVVDDGKLPRDKQIGATGKTVAASVYIAIGISGAVQHLQGINECGTVIAVNIDDTCDMAKRADITIISDAEEWMQEMIRRLDGSDTANSVADSGERKVG